MTQQLPNTFPKSRNLKNLLNLGKFPRYKQLQFHNFLKLSHGGTARYDPQPFADPDFVCICTADCFYLVSWMEEEAGNRIERFPPGRDWPRNQEGVKMSRNTILEKIQQLLETQILPLEPLLLAGNYRELLPHLDAVRQTVKDAGLWAPQLPVEVGGMGRSLAEFAEISEILGRSPLGHYCFNCQAPDAGNMELLLEFATPAQKKRFLEPLAAGHIRSCFAMTEPAHPGSNPVWMSTTAVREGEDYLINGHKWFTTAAEGADFAIVMCVTNPEAERPHERASQIIVPTDASGYRLVRNIPIMGEAGEGYFSHGEVRLENCRVPRENLLGQEGAGFVMAQKRLGPGRIHHGMRWIGIAQRSLEMMCRYAALRELSPGHPLARQQTIQNWIAESHAEISAARLLVLDTARKIDAQGASAARVEISLIKFYVAGVMQRVIDRAIQTHGGLGITEDTVLSHFYRHERGARIYDGPDEVHKTVVAGKLLRRYAGDETKGSGK